MVHSETCRYLLICATSQGYRSVTMSTRSVGIAFDQAGMLYLRTDDWFPDIAYAGTLDKHG
jgi:hypothetical protein